jgi:hypothetical protein
VWIERRLFELLGAWSGDTADPAARPVLAAHAAHHAWRAEVLADRLPRARGLEVNGWEGPANDRVVELVEAAAEPGPDQTAARLVGVYRVIVPQLGEAFLDHLDRLRPISDAPAMRWLRLVLRDEMADWRRGVDLLGEYDEGPVEPHRVRLAGLLRDAGGITGDLAAIRNGPSDEHTATPLLLPTRTYP